MAAAAELKAIIFDIDGTLVDSVDLHARAWQEAFAHFGHQIEFAAVRSQIGKGGDQLMPVFLSRDEVASRGEEIEIYRAELFKEKYLPKVHSFPAVRDLVQRIKQLGPSIVLASSAKGDELAAYKRIAGSWTSLMKRPPRMMPRSRNRILIFFRRRWGGLGAMFARKRSLSSGIRRTMPKRPGN